MSKADGAPTMIIPQGTEIQIDVHGQLSVRTPGNLVIQNSGHYGEIESVNGSIRIEAGAEVEAVSVRCAETCYVQGSLTSWRVQARSIHLEEQADARVVLQETESLEIGKNARMIGNFGSEKELFLLFSRFTQQLRSLPFYFDRQEPSLEAQAPPAGDLRGEPADGTERRGLPPAAARLNDDIRSLPNQVLENGADLPDQLFFALVLLEREAKNETAPAQSRRAVEELARLLRERQLEALARDHRKLRRRSASALASLHRA
ncbi:MAG: hypothetical protein AAGN46_12690, partial [Acidobacteriota bacterium]